MLYDEKYYYFSFHVMKDILCFLYLHFSVMNLFFSLYIAMLFFSSVIALFLSKFEYILKTLLIFYSRNMKHRIKNCYPDQCQ